MLLGPFDDGLAKTVAAYAGLPEFGVLQVKNSSFLFSVLVLQKKQFSCTLVLHTPYSKSISLQLLIF